MRKVTLALALFFLAPSLSEAVTPVDRGKTCAAAIKALSPTPTDALKVTAYTTCLSEYVQIPTVNPPGHESMAVEFLETIFKEVNIPTLKFVSAGKEGPRVNLVATLTPANALKDINGKEKETFVWNAPGTASVILLHHMDVVDVFPEQWAKPEYAFGGQIEAYPGRNPQEKFVWGRGSLDMKGIGMMQILSTILLKIEKVSFQKPIHLLAVSDEEQGESGALGALAEMKTGGQLQALMQATVLLNEGGFGAKDIIGKGTLMHAIGAEEKGGAWLKLEHESAVGLLEDLAKLRLAPSFPGGTSREARKTKCELVGFNTPKAKVNVSASKVEMTLKCATPPNEGILQRSFERAQKGTIVKVSVDDKTAKVELATSSSSHASVGLNASALDAIIIGLQKATLLRLKEGKKASFFQYYKTEATAELLRNIGEKHKFKLFPRIKGLDKWISRVPMMEQKALANLGAQLTSERLFRTSCLWSAFSVENGKAEALVDCRLIHPKAMGIEGSDHGKKFAEQFAKQINDPKLKVNVTESWDYTASPLEDPSLKILKEELQKENPTAVVTAFLFPGGTDSHLFRHAIGDSEFKGIPAYGFFPVSLGMDVVSTQHGSNERFPVDQTLPGLNIYQRVLSRLVK